MPEVDVNEVSKASHPEEEQDLIAEETMKDVTDDVEKDVKEDEWLDILGSGDLKIKTLQTGREGSRPQPTDICTIKFQACLEDGTVVDESENLIVEVNGSEVIQGLELVLAMLDVGQKVIAIIKPRFGYGTIGLPPKIPQNATLFYTVELLDAHMPTELTVMPFEDRINRALFKKEKGNWWYSRGEANKAVQCYRAGLDLLQESTPFTDKNEKVVDMPEDVFRQIVQHRLVIYNNLAAAQLLISAYDSALMSVENVIKLEPNNIKALFRKGKILLVKGNTDEAIEVFTTLSNIEPDNSAVKKELHLALKRQTKEKQQAKRLYKKMFRNDDNNTEITNTNEPRPPSGRTSTWTKVLGAAASATIVAVIAFCVGSKMKVF